MTGFNSKRLASKDSLQQAIDTLDGVMHPSEKTQRDITALRTALRSALAQPAPAPAVQSTAREIAAEQSYDPSLWFVASTVSEAHLQAALRRLTAAVEGEPVARTPLTDEKVWALATQCTVGSDLHIDKFARAIESAHGIGDKT